MGEREVEVEDCVHALEYIHTGARCAACEWRDSHRKKTKKGDHSSMVMAWGWQQ